MLKHYINVATVAAAVNYKPHLCQTNFHPLLI